MENRINFIRQIERILEFIFCTLTNFAPSSSSILLYIFPQIFSIHMRSFFIEFVKLGRISPRLAHTYSTRKNEAQQFEYEIKIWDMNKSSIWKMYYTRNRNIHTRSKVNNENLVNSRQKNWKLIKDSALKNLNFKLISLEFQCSIASWWIMESLQHFGNYLFPTLDSFEKPFKSE